MTDRFSAFIVTLDHDIREDDADTAITALRMVRGVIAVEPVRADIGQEIARMRANNEWTSALYALIDTLGRGGRP